MHQEKNVFPQVQFYLKFNWCSLLISLAEIPLQMEPDTFCSDSAQVMLCRNKVLKSLTT